MPEVLFEGKYYPICGHYFWSSTDGATTVCNLLGFKNAQMTQTKDAYDVDAIPVGTCKSGEPLTKCTIDGNIAWGDWVNHPYCKKGKLVGFTLTCDSAGVSSSGIGELGVCCVCLLCKYGMYVFACMYAISATSVHSAKAPCN